ncbi:MAG: short-chain-enoyl-CoA hydratase [Candidatus Elarobacter sp.]
MPSNFQSLIVSDRPGVRIATINRPEVHNALSLNTIDELGRALEEAESDGCACLIVTGSGDRTFCSGGDLNEFGELKTKESAIAMSLRMQRVSRAMRRSPLIVVVAMNGDAYGGGLEFALAADIRVAVSNARFGFFQVKLGITPAWRGATRLRDVMPRSRALLLLATGERFDADDALRWGLVDRLAEERRALDMATELAETIAANSRLAVRTIKRMVDAPLRDDDADMNAEAALFAEAWVSAEHWEAVAARRPGRR